METFIIFFVSKVGMFTFALNMTQEANILLKARQLFFRLGVRSITMDDLARELGVSKKTIYKFVDNKSDLVSKVMHAHFEEERKMMSNITSTSDNAIEEMIATVRKVLAHLRILHPSTIYDIQKYYPSSWKMFTDFKNHFIYSCIHSNIEKGKEQGLYRTELKPDITAKLYIALIDSLVNPKNFPAAEYNFSDLYREFIMYHLQGITSEAGRDYLKNLQFNLKDE